MGRLDLELNRRAYQCLPKYWADLGYPISGQPIWPLHKSSGLLVSRTIYLPADFPPVSGFGVFVPSLKHSKVGLGHVRLCVTTRDYHVSEDPRRLESECQHAKECRFNISMMQNMVMKLLNVCSMFWY